MNTTKVILRIPAKTWRSWFGCAFSARRGPISDSLSLHLRATTLSGNLPGMNMRNVRQRTIASRVTAQKKVGIFWFFDGRPIGSTYDLSRGVDTGTFIDSPMNHYEYWPRMQIAHSKLRAYDYIDIPRGRALFRKRDNQAVIYMDRVLFEAAIMRKIRQFFNAPAATCTFKPDEHYTTDEADLKKLFGK